MAAVLKAGKKRTDVLIYNRVPKVGADTILLIVTTGSTSWQALIRQLGKKQSFQMFQFVLPPAVQCPPPLVRPCITVQPQMLEAMKSNISGEISHFYNESSDKDTYIDWHFSYFNHSEVLPPARFRSPPPSPSPARRSSRATASATATGVPDVLNTSRDAEPLLMNTVREPISRLVSTYYYMRWGLRALRARRSYIAVYGELSIEDCLELYDRCGCRGDCSDQLAANLCNRSHTCQDLYDAFNEQMMYFCPIEHKACQLGHPKDEESLAHALDALHHRYDVVGIMERMTETNRLLELVIPRFFKGVTAMEIRHYRKGSGKKDPGPEAMRRLQELNALDVRFYNEAASLLERRLAAAEASPYKAVVERLMMGPPVDHRRTRLQKPGRDLGALP